MKNRLLVLSLLTVSSMSHAVEIEYSLGMGPQYGGISGSQVALKLEDSKYFVAAGFLGASLGGKYKISENGHHSLGFNLGSLANSLSDIKEYLLGTYNYHFSGFDEQGWELGAGVGFYREDEYQILSGSETYKSETNLTFAVNLGYTFQLNTFF